MAPKKHISKTRIGISHINPLIMKPLKVGISPQNAYAYVLFGSLIKECFMCTVSIASGSRV